MNDRWIRLLVLASTVVLAWGALTLGGEGRRLDLQPGSIAQREFRAQQDEIVEDVEATEALEQQAAASVEPVTRRDRENEVEVYEDVANLMVGLREGVAGESLPQPGVTPDTEPTPATTTSPPTTTTTAAAGETGAADTTTTTDPLTQAVLDGFVFLDVDGDGLFDAEAPAEEQWRPDFGLGNVAVSVRTPDGQTLTSETASDGTISLPVPLGQLVVTVENDAASFPASFNPSAGTLEQLVECQEADCSMQPVGIAPSIRPMEDQIADLAEAFPQLPEPTLRTLVTLASQDVVREARGEPLALETIEFETTKELSELFASGVTAANATDVKGRLQSDPPFFQIDNQRNDDAREAVADIITTFLVPNRVVDEAATEAAREEAMAEVEPVTRSFEMGELIASPGDRLSQLEIDAIRETGAATGQPVRELALAGILVVLVGILSFYLARFRPQFWEAPRMVTLWGLLIVLGAASVRLTLELSETASWYVLPAVAFGYLSAVLFDNRMGTLMALALAILTAAGTQDAGASVFAMMATLAPIGFVSKVSSRRAFRNSVLISSLSVAVIAASVAWFFDTNLDQQPWQEMAMAAGWALAASLVASLVALAAMPFFESLFDITTTLRLLELTDRNHDALQTLQEKAFGTFNHSLMVGTLADAASRAIGANNLLARAAAYYHDLGKTENPLYFIENQFGVPNPHDHLPPEESARIIRKHVTDGLVLAKRHKIPSEVAEGISTHHGDGIMRFFYEKARQTYGEADPDDYRHAGHKPTSKEMAIVMMADSVEGACRAVFGEEEPTPDAIAKVVNRVIDEKLADGQLGEADLTLGELTRVRRAFIEALVGHYHQRIPYPNFPGT